MNEPKKMHELPIPIYMTLQGLESKLKEEHICHGNSRSPSNCPVALSLNDLMEANKEILKQKITTKVGNESISFYDEENQIITTLYLDMMLVQWIEDFDDGKSTPTGTIYIEDERVCINVDSAAFYIDPEGEDNTINWNMER